MIVAAEGAGCVVLLANTAASGTLWWGFSALTQANVRGVPLAATNQVSIPMNAGDKLYVAGAGVTFSWARVRDTNS